MPPRQALRTVAEALPGTTPAAGETTSAAPAEADLVARAPVPSSEMPAPPQSTRPPAQAAAGKPRSRTLPLIGAVALLAVAAYGTYWWTTARFLVSTDDAYVGANIALLSARVPARVAEVRVDSNQRVKKDDPLVILDDGDYRLALDQAKARLATQDAAIARIGRQIEAARAAVLQAVSQREAADAELIRAEADLKRVTPLVQNKYSSEASLDTSRATRDKARAAMAAAMAGIASAEANVSVLEAQKEEARQSAAEFKVAVDKAARDLEATIIRAPLDGIVGNRSVQVGDYVTAGKRLAAIVPLDEIYIDANYKETQLAAIRPGATAHVTLDAAGGKAFEGRVLSLAPASGSQFSLLPPENATGNFTKIVQRVPVRIAVPRAIVEEGALRPGLSVVVTIDTRTGPAGAKAETPAK
jgi:membrane fusion protein (multidrug efflux system)